MTTGIAIPENSIITGIESLSLSANDIKRLNHPAIGGVLLFARNFESPEQLLKLTNSIHQIKSLQIAVDQEGGRVQRFRESFTKIPAMRALGALWDKDQSKSLEMARACGQVMSFELKQCGIDITFAPVLDIDYQRNPMIGDRCFHTQPAPIAELACSLIQGLHNNGMRGVAKHFPGHGYVIADSHLQLPIDERPFDDFERNDLYPFRQVFSQGLSDVMMAHLLIPKYDNNLTGFSKKLIQYLRQDLHFSGCIYSDDLGMQAVANLALDIRIKRCIDAGCDVVIFGNQLQEMDILLERNHITCDGTKANTPPLPLSSTETLPSSSVRSDLRKLAENWNISGEVWLD